MNALDRARLILAALWLAAGLAAPFASAGAASGQTGRYAVEFRARPGGVFGHTYVVYGPVDDRGRLQRPRYAGLYPSGFLSDTALLGVVATPSFISFKPRDWRVRPEMVYRREISARAYASLEGEVSALRRSRPFWHLILYNCNSFAADVAQSLGLRAPPTLMLPKDFVRDLYALNRRSGPSQAFAAATVRPVGGRVSWPSDLLYMSVAGDEP